MESERIIERIDSVTNEKSYDLEWRYNEESDYFNIDGSTHVAGDFSSFRTRINKLQVNSDFLFDVVDNGEKLEVLVRSTNPYINVTGMQSVMIDPKQSKTIKQYFKPKRWGLGVQLGVGIDKQLQFTPYIGIGLSYNLIVF